LSRTYNSTSKKPSVQERIDEHLRKLDAARREPGDRQRERDDLALRLLGIAESLRMDPDLDCRQLSRVQIDFNEDGSAIVLRHSRVFPTYRHVVAASAVDAMLEKTGGDT
jgi:hypothetical protein